MINTVLFDLDGTLLPVDYDTFTNAYFKSVIKKFALMGYDAELLKKAIWKGTGAMTENTGEASNREVFWQAFAEYFPGDTDRDEERFGDYYENEFQNLKSVCGVQPLAKEVVDLLKAGGVRRILATNPIFPDGAIKSRIRWAGLDPDDFEYITSYEYSSYCKPNPDYFREIVQCCNLEPEKCLMVGNSVSEDLAAEKAGMKVFLITDCLVNDNNEDYSSYPNGSFSDCISFIKGLL